MRTCCFTCKDKHIQAVSNRSCLCVPPLQLGTYMYVYPEAKGYMQHSSGLHLLRLAVTWVANSLTYNSLGLSVTEEAATAAKICTLVPIPTDAEICILMLVPSWFSVIGPHFLLQPASVPISRQKLAMPPCKGHWLWAPTHGEQKGTGREVRVCCKQG